MIKQLGIVVYGTYSASASKYPIADWTDMAGHKMGALGRQTPIQEYSNQIRIPVTSQEAYISLAQGIIDGIMTGHDSLVAWRLWEVTDYAFVTAVNYNTTMMWFNMDKWNTLPADIQDIIENKVVPELEHFANDTMAIADQRIFDQLEANFLEVTYASAEAYGRARTYLQNESESFANLIDAIGPDLMAIIDEYRPEE